jgi:hypothetical protein
MISERCDWPGVASQKVVAGFARFLPSGGGWGWVRGIRDGRNATDARAAE